RSAGAAPAPTRRRGGGGSGRVRLRLSGERAGRAGRPAVAGRRRTDHTVRGPASTDRVRAGAGPLLREYGAFDDER
ncbi:MAG TPA: hypothetical protein VM367_05855, partial [Pseudonocardia sp.]|nr:hypothetical protein [Pseudonocardia sp.]